MNGLNLAHFRKAKKKVEEERRARRRRQASSQSEIGCNDNTSSSPSEHKEDSQIPVAKKKRKRKHHGIMSDIISGVASTFGKRSRTEERDKENEDDTNTLSTVDSSAGEKNYTEVSEHRSEKNASKLDANVKVSSTSDSKRKKKKDQKTSNKTQVPSSKKNADVASQASAATGTGAVLETGAGAKSLKTTASTKRKKAAAKKIPAKSPIVIILSSDEEDDDPLDAPKKRSNGANIDRSNATDASVDNMPVAEKPASKKEAVKKDDVDVDGSQQNSKSDDEEERNFETEQEDCRNRNITRPSPDASPRVTLQIDPNAVKCWSCDVDLGTLRYSHPLLEVFTCSVCANNAHAVEDEIQTIIEENQNDSKNNTKEDVKKEIDICSWCADEDKQGETLLMCDVCPRSFCNHCVSLAHGSGSEGDMAVKNIEKSDDPWSCLHCECPILLKTMQLRCTETNVDDNYLSGGGISDQCDNIEDVLIEKLLDRLGEIESEVRLLEPMLETKGIEKHKRELERRTPKSSNLQVELDEWIRSKQILHSNYTDEIGILQDDLESKGISMRIYYKTCTDLYEPKSSEESVRKQADMQLDKNDEKEGFQKGFSRGASGWRGDEENYVDIEDLSSSELDNIEDINPTKDAVKQLELIVQKKTFGKNADFSRSLIDKNTIRNFKRIVPRDERELKDLKAKIRIRQRNEILDIRMEESIEKRENTRLVQRDGTVVRIVRRHGERLRQKKTNQRKKPNKRIALNSQETNQTKKPKKRITPTSINIDNRQVNHCYGNGGEKGALFKDSSCVLAQPSPDNPGSSEISVASPLAKLLKPHQINGVKFMWKNSFDDIVPQRNPHNSVNPPDITKRGCILAHNMGLGKTLQVVALIHALLTHPSLIQKVAPRRRIIDRILLIVPVNTLENWKAEFSKWIVNLPNLCLFDFSSSGKKGRETLANRWVEKGGVMLITHDTLARAVKKGNGTNFHRIFQAPGPDAIFIDEGHIMLKNNKSGISKVLSSMKTSRRIVLTGTPLQNNLTEFYRMADWIRPGCLGTELQFERKFENPIMSSLTSDASDEAQKVGEELLKELFDTISPYIQRLDSTILKKDLPHIQQAVIHIKQTKVQMKLYRAFRKHYQKNSTSNNFLEQYSKLFPVNNHPGALLHRRISTSDRQAKLQKKKTKKKKKMDEQIVTEHTSAKRESIGSKPNCVATTTTKRENYAKGLVSSNNTDQVVENSQGSVEVIVIDDSSDEEEDGKVLHAKKIEKCADDIQEPTEQEEDEEQVWWEDVHRKVPHLDDIENGGKAIILLQILAHSELLGDKVVVFSQCLKTLDFIESIIQLPDWSSKLQGVTNLTKTKRKFGGWTSGIDYLRIDGQTSAAERGILINQFNGMKHSTNNEEGASADIDRGTGEKVKTFLISSKAGSVGINLVAANRVVIFDSAWNPAIDLQALYRCYRYGQLKPVYAYRLLTDTSMEEKVYSRSVNKSSLAARVIDQKDPKRNFSQKDISNIMHVEDNWAQCDKCDKWRMLHPVKDDDTVLPEQWFCCMNIHDKARSDCDAEEKSNKWMSTFYEKEMKALIEDANPVEVGAESSSTNEEKGHSQASQSSIGSQSTPTDSLDEHNANTKRDAILMGLMKIRAPKADSKKKRRGKMQETTTKALITKYYFHDSLMKEASASKTRD